MESFGTIFEKNQMDNNFSWLFIYANSYKTAKNLTTKPITPLGKKRGRKKTERKRTHYEEPRLSVLVFFSSSLLSLGYATLSYTILHMIALGLNAP